MARREKNRASCLRHHDLQLCHSESPLVFVVCTPGGAEATVVALNKKRGDVV
jgi:hypothetical protein